MPRICSVCDKVIGPTERFYPKFGHDNRLYYFHLKCPKDESMNNSIDTLLTTAAYARKRIDSEAIFESEQPFYIIFNPGSEKPSRIAFTEQVEAFRVAEQMARKHPDEKFFVLRTVGFAQTQQPVVVSKFQNELTASTKKTVARKK